MLKFKDQVHKIFKEWVTKVETLTGKKVNFLITDNDLEFLSNPFVNFYNEHGITRHATISYTPQ